MAQVKLVRSLLLRHTQQSSRFESHCSRQILLRQNNAKKYPCCSLLLDEKFPCCKKHSLRSLSFSFTSSTFSRKVEGVRFLFFFLQLFFLGGKSLIFFLLPFSLRSTKVLLGYWERTHAYWSCKREVESVN